MLLLYLAFTIRIFHTSLKIILKNLTVFRIFARWRVKEGKVKKETQSHTRSLRFYFCKNVGHWMGKILDGHVAYLVLFACDDLHTNIHISFIACAAGSNVRVNPLDSRGSSKVTWKKLSAHFNFVVSSGRHVAKLAQK